MNINTKILSVNDGDGTAVVRFYTSVITETDLATQVDPDTGAILRCSTDYNCWLPRAPLQGDALIAFLRQNAPTEMFERMERARLGAGPVDTSAAKALLGQVAAPAVVATELTLAQAKADKLAAIKLHRQAKEAAGVMVGSVSIATDADSQSRIGGALASMQNGFLDQVEWKGENGWATLDLAAIKAVSQAVAKHVQSCFTWERGMCAQVDAATTIDQVNAINFNVTVIQ